ncbi:uncharacterized protein HRG_08928 [Hirsutella rhossiliensis]|uniref:Uncharacterized protein n=1 Tax=Hirsutella rhossiliensis TaxID=111463 RepID=A0A9P8MVF5_9HYPO|nr:uncharacterized protein HRG_08928 [Hirsutella rhossiliensis]KAH0959907.1 hypothetical protein HRG_08928 [Hirsutella rhossiliensis]
MDLLFREGIMTVKLSQLISEDFDPYAIPRTTYGAHEPALLPKQRLRA